MTRHVRQRNENDCTLASIAMAIGLPYSNVWTAEDTALVGKERNGLVSFVAATYLLFTY